MPTPTNSRTLVELKGFGLNPGALRCWMYLPSILAPNAPLVVALHGCTQTADGFDHGSGWSQLAEQKGFAVIFPEQQRSNNANLCFNWFEPADARRDSGEALSIREMVTHVVESLGLDSESVFVTGLSAGGAMANVMLATYPELFAGGAIIGGLPFGVTAGVAQAFERMQGRSAPNSSQLRSTLESASSHSGPWPKISVWHGTHDHTVKPNNADQIGSQWSGVHRVTATHDREENVNGHVRKVWLDGNQEEAVEIYMVKGMAHGVPLSTGARVPVGNAGPFMLDAGISSTVRIAATWGLADVDDIAEAEAVVGLVREKGPDLPGIENVLAKALGHLKTGKRSKGVEERPVANEGIAKTINDALRAAGLLR